MALTVKLTKAGDIVIKVTKRSLARATRLNPEHWVEDTRTGRQLLPKMPDQMGFAREVHNILADGLDGSDTLVREMFEKAISEVIEGGSLNVVTADDEDYGRKVFANE